MITPDRNGNSRSTMTKRQILVAVVSVFVSLLVFQVADARKNISGRMLTTDALQGYCNEHGGTYFPPGVGGAYACLLPDGTLIVCGGSWPHYCVESTRTWEDKGLGLSEVQTRNIRALATDYERFRIRAQADLDLAELEVEALVHDEKSDIRAIENALKKSEATRTAMRVGGVKAMRATSAVLTPEQREKWRSRIEMLLKDEEGYKPGAQQGAREPAKKPTP
jgi:Spy/CpxP family protein refolding chaperone